MNSNLSHNIHVYLLSIFVYSLGYDPIMHDFFSGLIFIVSFTHGHRHCSFLSLISLSAYPELLFTSEHHHRHPFLIKLSLLLFPSMFLLSLLVLFNSPTLLYCLLQNLPICNSLQSICFYLVIKTLFKVTSVFLLQNF